MSTIPGLAPHLRKSLQNESGWLPRRKLSKSTMSLTEASKELSSEGDPQPQSPVTRSKPEALRWEALAPDYPSSERLRGSRHRVDLSLAAAALKTVCAATETLLLLPPSQNNYQLQHGY